MLTHLNNHTKGWNGADFCKETLINKLITIIKSTSDKKQRYNNRKSAL